MGSTDHRVYTHCFANMHLSVNKYVHGDSVVHSMHLSALSSQQVFFGRDVGQINSQAVAQIWCGVMSDTGIPLPTCWDVVYIWAFFFF